LGQAVWAAWLAVIALWAVVTGVGLLIGSRRRIGSAAGAFLLFSMALLALPLALLSTALASGSLGWAPFGVTLVVFVALTAWLARRRFVSYAAAAAMIAVGVVVGFVAAFFEVVVWSAISLNT
jgi:hypothetical protein